METSIEISRNLALSFEWKLSAKFPAGSFPCIGRSKNPGPRWKKNEHLLQNGSLIDFRGNSFSKYLVSENSNFYVEASIIFLFE